MVKFSSGGAISSWIRDWFIKWWLVDDQLSSWCNLILTYIIDELILMISCSWWYHFLRWFFRLRKNHLVRHHLILMDLRLMIVHKFDSISYWYDSFDWERIISCSSIEDNWRMLIMIVHEIDSINSSWLNLIDECW